MPDASPNDSLDPVAERILSALIASARGLSRTEISGRCGRHVPAESIKQALGSLEASRLALREVRKATRGRPTEVWHATEAAREEWSMGGERLPWDQ
jgi:predicted ArsR family transcriptional regulator